MKKIITTIALLASLVATGQFQFGQKESFAFSIYVDPSASIKSKGLNIGAEIEYKGAIYAKGGIESFADLPGGYFDVHGAAGPRFTFGRFENLALYLGGKAGVVFRNNAPNPIGGFEGGLDYVFQNGMLIGLGGSYIYRGDMKSMQLPEIWQENFSVRIGYSWDWKQ